MPRYHVERRNGIRYLRVDYYTLPPEVAHLYNASGSFSLLISLDDQPYPQLYVPNELQCYQGHPMHLNQDAPEDLEADGWKRACWILYNWDPRRYTAASLVNAADEYFAGYPYNQGV